MKSSAKGIKTPLKYYGGKTQLLPELLPLLNGDNSTTFVSLFTGGGACEFAKQHHPVEIWNDTLLALGNFYEVCKTSKTCHMLKRKLRSTAYSEYNYHKAKNYYKRYSSNYPSTMENKVRFAWATFLMCNATFAAGILKGFAFSSTRNNALTFRNKVAEFSVTDLVKRTEHVVLMCRDAVELYKLFNKKDTLFYADPPYYNSDCGHYQGYSLEQFTELLNALGECKGKFILSSYDSEILQECAKKYGWFVKKIAMNLSMQSANKTTKTECITTNFDQIKATNETISMF